MADTATLNVRMDADTKTSFIAFCEELGLSASSLMNIFAKTVVRNHAVPFPMTTQPLEPAQQRYSRIFPASDQEFEERLVRSAATPLGECLASDEATGEIERRMGW